MTFQNLPTHAQILVIGGGPAGSYAASALAREGFDVCVLESSKFPRYHIGESLLPSVAPFLDFIGAKEKIEKHGFVVKPGAAVKFQQNAREGYTDFVVLDKQFKAWNVVRSEFDEVLLRHSEECGARVFEETKVNSLDFEGDRPVRAHYVRQGSTTGSIAFDYLVDASGRTGIMSTKYLKNRRMNESLKNIACWGYWSGTSEYMPGTSRQNAPWFESLTDESGWAWFIPLHDGTTSVGFVMDLATSNEKKRAASSTKQHYLDQFQFAPGLQKLIGDGELVTGHGKPDVQSASDYSYSADKYAGDHFRLIGDASAFIDPFFSSGVHLALSGAMSAAISISASIRQHCPESDASMFHDEKVGTSYTRFLLVVMGSYKQIRNQTISVMKEVKEDNFDHAFDMIRPIIQGASDVDRNLTEQELQRTMDFVAHVMLTRTDPEMVDSVKARLPEKLFTGEEILLEEDIEKLIDPEDEEARFVLRELNARKPIHNMYNGPMNMSNEMVNGYVGVVKRGSLGMNLAMAG
ncbi:hypothetical protein VNI00_006523 [Paramarasmius palmivorus]|uniref:FAD-binding domain-containing protein n=1 Tax=Paramarasmius palmivorus TaxID=297713 RepID=A0AAW0D7U2_9AGAR